MEKDEKIAKIKKDLRRLRKITHSVEVALQVKERHERRLSYLEQEKPSKENIEEAQKIRKNLASLRIDDIIKEATTLESLYMEAISKLEPLDRTIILDGYINGKAYWKIGRDIGYTEVGIQKRVNKIIEILANLI